jgi:hypothetical protein
MIIVVLMVGKNIQKSFENQIFKLISVKVLKLYVFVKRGGSEVESKKTDKIAKILCLHLYLAKL